MPGQNKKDLEDAMRQLKEHVRNKLYSRMLRAQAVLSEEKYRKLKALFDSEAYTLLDKELTKEKC